MSIQDEADTLRRRANQLSPPIEVAPAAAVLGVGINRQHELDCTHRGLLIPQTARRPVILIDRRAGHLEARFLVAHEFWHVLHADGEPVILSGYEMVGEQPNWQEKDADRFAIEYLMPAQLVDQHFWSHRRVEELAQLFLVDVEIMARRLAGLELLRFRIYEDWERDTVPRWLVA